MNLQEYTAYKPINTAHYMPRDHYKKKKIKNIPIDPATQKQTIPRVMSSKCSKI